MYKKLLSILIISVCFGSLCVRVDAQEMTDWTYKMVSTYSDQDERVYISRFENRINPDLTAFCLESTVQYNSGSTYEKVLNDDDYIFKLVRAYNTHFKQIEDKNEYYIATQILIWEETSETSYTFKNNDYFNYKEEIVNYINSMSETETQLIDGDTDTHECYLGEEYTINEDYSEYNVHGDGVEIIENSADALTFVVNELEPINKQIILEPVYDPKDYSYSYISNDSQNLYIFEGTYTLPETVYMNILTLTREDEYTSINYSKKDLKGKPIVDTEFGLYEINADEGDEELIFIQKSTPIDLYELLRVNVDQYANLALEVSQRYQKYLNEATINADEIGYFDCKVYADKALIKEKKVYVSDDMDQTDGSYLRIAVKAVFKGFSGDLQVNQINNIKKNKRYYLCETEPARGYEYTHNACKLVDTGNYSGETIEFNNANRRYTLQLLKHDRDDILLNGAKFKISYLENDKEVSSIYTTGSLNIKRINDNKYLIYKHQNDKKCQIVEFDGDHFCLDKAAEGNYYYYQANSDVVDDSLLSNSINVIKGGFMIENLPYDSSLTVEELEAPNGYMIGEATYSVEPNIEYSKIVFTNYRINEFIILPKTKYRVPKTCIDG